MRGHNFDSYQPTAYFGKKVKQSSNDGGKNMEIEGYKFQYGAIIAKLLERNILPGLVIGSG